MLNFNNLSSKSMSNLYYFDQDFQCAVDLSFEEPQHISDPYSANSFEEALDLMTEPGTHRDFMSFPINEDIFNMNLNMSFPVENIMIEIIFINDSYSELYSFFSALGNNEAVAEYAASNLSQVYHKFYEATSDKYQVTFKIFARGIGELDWHKDRNDDSNDVDSPAEYNIALPLTKPGTWFCKASEYERSQYDQ